MLARSGLLDTFAYYPAGFAVTGLAEQVTGRLSQYADLEIDSIADRSRDAVAVSCSGRRATFTDTSGVACKATGAGIGRGNQDETARKHRVTPGPSHRQAALLEWLPQSLQRVATEFGELIEKQDSTVRPGHLARQRHSSSSTNQTGRRDAVVW
jgi:hypothetical protein